MTSRASAKATVVAHPALEQAEARKSVAAAPPLDVAKVRKDFPILERRVHGKRLVYLDSAATTQKPQAVLDALVGYYSNYNANVHRGIHTLAEEATAAYEATRRQVAALIGCKDAQEIVFTRNTTESINLLAAAWGNRNLKAGDEILLSEMEHHSNLVPWILLARRTGARLRHIPITAEGKLDLSQMKRLLTSKTRIVAVTQLSNVLGTINPVGEIAEQAHRVGALIAVDGAQSVPHLPVNVEQLEIDFLSFSSHKMLGPTGVGVLWGKREHLEAMDPYMGGGEMIRKVELDSATWADVPQKFEAGTPNIAGVIAFRSAIDYLLALGLEQVRRHELELTGYALERLRSLGHLTLYGPEKPEERSGVLSFNDRDIHAHDLSTLLDHQGVAIRAGHHCAQPLMRILGVPATARASFYVYNDEDDMDALIEALQEARKYFGFHNA